MTAAQLDADQIRKEAQDAARVADSESELFDRNLDALVSSLNSEGDLPDTGAAEAHAEFVRAMANRLETLRWIDEYPAIDQEILDRPIFLTGLPRSGTTFFQQLFDRNPDFRLIRTWETHTPCPPPAIAPDSVAARVAAVNQHDDQLRLQITEFDSIHLRDSDGAEECHNFLAQTFSAVGFQNYMNVPSYTDYLFSELDFEAAYRVHARQLKLLQWGAPARRWAVKYPNHLIAMPEILEIHPEATFVLTHRDPVQTLASLCRLTDAFRAPRMRAVNHADVGPQIFDFVSRHLDRLMAFVRSDASAGRLVNVDYYDLLGDPADTMTTAYDGLSIEMPDGVRRSIIEWRTANPKGKRGNSPYRLEQFGLDEHEVVERFADYTQHFGIPRESEGMARLERS
jgi:Sulfotransferase family